MDVRCERCRAQYVFDDEQVTASGLTVQCTNCGHLFKVKKKELVVTVPVKPDEVQGAPLPASSAAPRPGGTSTGTATPAAERAEAERAREWRVRQANGNIFTFRELTTLQKWIIEQKVSRDDEISLAGDQSWKRLGNIAELASFFQVVEAAERGRTQSAMPAVTPLPMPAVPAYGVALQSPLYPPAPPPPSGFPPPAFAAPLPPSPAWAAEPQPVLPPPVHEIDLGTDLEPPPKRRGGRALLAVALLVVAGGAGAYLFVPGLMRPEPKRQEVAPLTIEVKPEPPPVAPPAPVQEPAPVAPPEPVAAPPKPAPKGAKALLADAARLRERGATERALELYGRVASDDPENVEALTGRGLCYLDLESYGPAEASLEAALRLDPRDPDARLGLAETYRFEGKKAEAIQQYERYLADNPDGEEAEVARNALEDLRR